MGWDGLTWHDVAWHGLRSQQHLSVFVSCHRRRQSGPWVRVLLLTLQRGFPTFLFAPGRTCCFVITGQGAYQTHISGLAVMICCPHTAWLI